MLISDWSSDLCSSYLLNRFVFDSVANRERYVVLQPVTFHPNGGYLLHQQLRAIDHNYLISQLQTGQTAGKDEMFMPKAQLMECYRQFPQLLATTHALL